MDDRNAWQRRDTEPEETVHPDNPPRSVVGPRARNRWFLSSFGLVVAIFALVAVVFAIVALRDSSGDGPAEPVGTSGTGQMEETGRTEDTPGGFDPASTPDDTEDEIERRGGN